MVFENVFELITCTAKVHHCPYFWIEKKGSIMKRHPSANLEEKQGLYIIHEKERG